MKDTFDTIELEKITIEIYSDDNPESPREWSNLGTMACWHNRYNLGDNNPFSEPDDFYAWLKDNPSIVMPLYLYDHSGISMSASSFVGRAHHAEWDSGQVGYIYVTKEKIKQEYGWQYLTTARIAKIKQYLMNEVEIYDDYLTGNVYYYMTRCNQCGQYLDSCWGYYGTNWKDNGLLESAEGSECEDCKVTNERLEQVTQLEFSLGV